MLTLMTAALVAAQPAPPADGHRDHAQAPHGQSAPMQMQHSDTMKDCCQDCCKGMDEHKDHAARQSDGAH